MKTIRISFGLVASLALLAGVVVFAGCSKGSDSGGAAPSGGAPPTSAGAPNSAGAPAGTAAAEGDKAVALFKQNCASCHKMGDVGGGKAPDLTKAGAEEGHDAAWFAAQIKDPKTHNPGAKMPAFAAKLSEDDIKALSEHLAAMK